VPAKGRQKQEGRFSLHEEFRWAVLRIKNLADHEAQK
jgi:hypothetical protein